MARPRKKPHELVPYRVRNSAAVSYGGGKVYLGPWDRDRDEPSAAALSRLAELVALWRADPDAGLSRPGDPLLLAVWADWRDSPEGAGRLEEQAARAERFLFGSEGDPGPYRYHRVTAFRGEELRVLQRLLCDAKLSRDSVTKTINCVRACFQWALTGRRVSYEQFRELELVRPPARGQVKEAVRRRAAEWDDVATVLPRLSPPLAAVVRLLWHTGARPSELLGLRADHVRRAGVVRAASGVAIDLDGLGVWCAVKEEHKTDAGGYDRVIFFGPQARAVLAPVLDGRAAGEYLFRPADGRAWDLARKRARRTGGGNKKKGATDPKRAPGACYDYHALTTAVRRACRAAGVRWTPYGLRHAAGVAVQQAFGREAARVFLGHQVGGVTERYAGVDLALAAKVAKEWG